METSRIHVERKYIVLTILLSFCLKGIVFFTNTDISLISDNIGDLALPSYLAGLDWLELISYTSYYGYGFKWAYTIFFLLTDNPYVIYMGIQLLHLVLECILAAVIYYCSIKYWGIKQGWITVAWISIVISAAGISMNSEGQVYMAFWVLCLLVVALVRTEDIRNKRVYSIAVGVWCCYMLTIHERCLAAIIALCVLIVFYWLYEKKWLVELKVFIPVFILCYFTQEVLTNYVIKLFWSARSADGTLKNTSVFQSTTLWFIESWNNIKILLQIIFSNLYTLIIKTYGLGIVAIVISALILIGVINKKKNLGRKIYEDNKELSVIILLSAFTVLIIIIGVAVRWGRLVANGNMIGYKGAVYARYYLAFAWAGALATILLWRQIEEKIIRKSRLILSVSALLATILMLDWIYPLLKDVNESVVSINLERMGLLSNVASLDINYNNYFSIALLLVFIILLMFIRDKKIVAIYTMMVLCLVIFTKTNGFKIVKPSIRCSQFDASYDWVKSMEDQLKLDNYIYYYGDRPYNCQFMLNKYTVSWKWAPNDIESAIVFSNKSPEELLDEIQIEEAYYYIKLDNEEYLYVKGMNYIAGSEENGYKLEPVKR